jgi:hypothetical protein
MLQIAGYGTVPYRLLGQFHVYAKPGCPMYFPFRIGADGAKAIDVHRAIRRLFPELTLQEGLVGA